MPANRMNFVVTYRTESQVYGTATEEIALETPPPDGISIEDKKIFFITQRPDDGTLVLHEIPPEKVRSAELKLPKPKKNLANPKTDN